MTMDLERTVSELIRQVETRYHGKYRGLVVDSADPEHLGRLRLQVPSVLGDEVITGWAMPCVPYGGNADSGWFALPDKGAAVWVEFEEGDLEFPVWVGTYWSKPGGKSELPTGNAADGSAQTAAPSSTRKILKTSRGHTIQLEDASGEEMILLYQAAQELRVVMDADGIKLATGNDSFVHLAADGSITVHATGALTLEAPGQPVTIVGDTVAFTKG